MRWLHAIILAGLIGLLAVPAGAASPPPVEDTTGGMVSTSQRYATEVGVEILRQGGNAIDAAIAVGYALAVTNPCCGNIGGGGFMTIHLANGKNVFLNFRETAPAAATETMFLDPKTGNVVPNLSLVGYLAVGVPGTVLGLETARERYGSLPREKLMAPAIRLAREGFILHQGDVDILESTTRAMASQPNVASIFLKDGKARQAGEKLVQTHLAGSLQMIADKGPDAFYRGPIADAIVAASQANGGILTKRDFEAYTVTESDPITCTYRDFSIFSAPPPSSGGVTLCEILNILEGYPIGFLGFNSAQTVHVTVEAMRHAYLDRNSYLGDPAFVNNPLDRLLSKDYAAKIRQKIDLNRATLSRDLAPGVAPHEGTETTHYSVVDKAGNAVAVTYTINALFGARVIAGDTGFFLNDEMDDFTAKPGVANLFGLVQGKANSIQPGKRPLSSMTPTIVTAKNGKPFLVTGSPGGSRIISITLATIVNVIDHGMNIQEAVDAPRIHHQWLPDVVYAEPRALSLDTARILAGMGHNLVTQTSWGAAEAILIGPDTPLASGGPTSSGNDAMLGGGAKPNRRYGGHDNRRPAGAAIGN